MTKTEAANLLSVPVSTVHGFESKVDPFNPQNTVSGFICRKPDYRYGALVINTVNEHTIPQVVLGTPKLRYPFFYHAESKQRTYCFPEYKRCEVSTKLDGTNILKYSYIDSSINTFYTYKTRLSPFVSNNKYAPLLDLLKECLSNKPIANRSDLAISYEMTGYKNPLTIRYPYPLTLEPLFGVVPKTGEIVLLQRGQRFVIVEPPTDLPSIYEKLREDAENANKTLPDGMIDGTEGYVFAVIGVDNVCSMWKCKPASIEDLHWQSNTIPESSIRATIYNGLEDLPEGQGIYEHVCALLAEEFSELQIKCSKERIVNNISYVVSEIDFVSKLRSHVSGNHLTWRKDTVSSTMGCLSHFYPKSEMRKVHFYMKRLFGEPKMVKYEIQVWLQATKEWSPIQGELYKQEEEGRRRITELSEIFKKRTFRLVAIEVTEICKTGVAENDNG